MDAKESVVSLGRLRESRGYFVTTMGRVMKIDKHLTAAGKLRSYLSGCLLLRNCEEPDTQLFAEPHVTMYVSNEETVRATKNPDRVSSALASQAALGTIIMVYTSKAELQNLPTKAAVGDLIIVRHAEASACLPHLAQSLAVSRKLRHLCAGKAGCL